MAKTSILTGQAFPFVLNARPDTLDFRDLIKITGAHGIAAIAQPWDFSRLSHSLGNLSLRGTTASASRGSSA